VTRCCAPSREPGRAGSRADVSACQRVGNLGDEFVTLAGGRTLVGSDDPDHPEEWPVREVEVAPFRIARCAVSNADFAAFVEATGYRTNAEEYGWSFVFGTTS
jgi:sulfatase modifying factor 1